MMMMMVVLLSLYENTIAILVVDLTSSRVSYGV